MTAELFYVKDILHAGGTAYAALFAAWMAGMVAGAVALPQRVPRAAIPAVALLALAVQGAGMAGQTIVLALPAAFAGFVVGGIGHGLKNALIRTAIADRVPRHAHGRAFAAYNAARNAAETGALAAGGLLVAGLGPRTALLVAGLGPVIAAAGGLLALAAEHRERGFASRLQPLANDA
jgi:hypothetical protein